MKDPFAPAGALRLKPVDVVGFPAPMDLRPDPDGEADARLTAGRAEDNDIALVDGRYPSVSAHHCRFERRGPALSVVDLSSSNGTLINGHPIEGTVELALGDVVRLGSVGPKFLVVGSRELNDTVFVRREELRPNTGEVEAIVKRGRRGSRLRLAVLAALLMSAAAWVAWDSRQSASDMKDELDARSLTYEQRLAEAYAEIAALDLRERDRAKDELDRSESRLATLRSLEGDLIQRAETLEASVTARAAEETRLRDRVVELERTGSDKGVLDRVVRDLDAARADLDTTRSELRDARRKVDLLDPVNLAQARVSGVADVRRTVVLIENKVRIRNVETGAMLFLEGAGPTAVPNFEGRGSEFVLESTGSGFCVDAGGWIFTNAHVVGPPDNELLRAIRGTPLLEQIVELTVVFSDESTRYAAEIHSMSRKGADLALLKIEPFEGMPVLEGFSTEVALPQPGSDIFLLGFPLGFLAVQEGETVISSIFRGILSRKVGDQIQVDAGVHPGNSGGPITDTVGRVVGIVVSVQALPDQTAVYTIGYGIPIAAAAELWPPAESSE